MTKDDKLEQAILETLIVNYCHGREHNFMGWLDISDIIEHCIQECNSGILKDIKVSKFDIAVTLGKLMERKVVERDIVDVKKFVYVRSRSERN